MARPPRPPSRHFTRHADGASFRLGSILATATTSHPAPTIEGVRTLVAGQSSHGAPTGATEGAQKNLTSQNGWSERSVLVGDTGFEPVTSSVSRKRATTAPIARGGCGNRTRVQGFAGPCLSHSA